MNKHHAGVEDSPASGFSRQLLRLLDFVESSHGSRRTLPWLILITGLVVWTAAQTYLVAVPVWTRDMLPELEDTLAYVVRTQEMNECFFQDCPALLDLRKQLEQSTAEPDVIRQHEIGSFPFPIYHPLFSVILLGIEKCGLDLMTAYKVLWTLAPLFFGLAIAYLLGTLWGASAAGVALSLLAFKVFPDRGMHYVIPSGLAMGLAMVVWARIISRRGDAPWTLVIGTVLLIGMHPVGGVFAIMGMVMALSMPGAIHRRRLWVAVLSVLLVGCVTLVLASFIRRPSLSGFIELASFPRISEALARSASNLIGALVEIVRMKDGLFGSLALYSFAVALGFFSASKERRQIILRMVLISSLFLVGALFHSHKYVYPADMFLRMWIPAFVVVFGAVGNVICFTLGESVSMLKERLRDFSQTNTFSFQKLWSVFALALVLGYSMDTVLAGSEQIYATAEFMRNRQPLNFSPEQPGLLLSRSRPEDRVIYTSAMAMGYYFANGAMKLGAIYYHPVFERTSMVTEWLQRPDAAFVVAYNPTVYHPAHEGLDENSWRITAPDFRFSPLMKPIKHGTINQGGYIPAADFRWIEITRRGGSPARVLRLLVKNPGESSEVGVVPVAVAGDPLHEFIAGKTIPSRWTGWVEFEIDEAAEAERFRIVLPKGQPEFLIGGIVFNEDKNHWPWEDKADLTFAAKDPVTGEVVRSFDPAKILPSPLNRLKVSVLDDQGSSVLFRIER